MSKLTKYYLIILYLLIYSINIYSKIDKVNDSNFLSIKGTSNVNSFEFINSSFSLNKPINILSDSSIQQELTITVKNFEPRNSLMYSDFLELLNVDKYPEINILIKKIIKDSNHYHITPNVAITLSGITREFNIDCKLSKQKNGKYLLSGNKKILLSDFRIKPPVKFFNMIKVDNEIDIEFCFYLNLQN